MSAVYSYAPVLGLHIGYFLIILAISSLSQLLT